MKLITRNTDYAVKALRHMCRQKGRVVSIEELTAALDTPRPFLRTILQLLNRRKILRSFKGRSGGFVLAVSPKKILLVDLMEIFQGPFLLNECLFKKEMCADRFSCALRRKIRRIEGRVTAQLRAITLASLL